MTRCSATHIFNENPVYGDPVFHTRRCIRPSGESHGPQHSSWDGLSWPVVHNPGDMIDMRYPG